jgi:hypothetical protein
MLAEFACRLRRCCRCVCFFISIVTFFLISIVHAVPFDPSMILFHYRGETDNTHLGAYLTSLGDINGDGFDDVAMSSGLPAGTYVFFGGNPVDSFSDMLLTGHYGAMDPVDFDGDGINDVATKAVYNGLLDPTGVIYFFRGYGDSLGSIPYDSVKPMPDNYNCAWDVVTGYVDRDSLGDLLTCKKTVPGGPILYYYSGCPALDKEADWSFAVEDYRHLFSRFGFIDFNGDGWQDIYLGMFADIDTLGYVYIFHGPDFGVDPDVIIGHPVEIPPFDPEYFAYEVTNYGDVGGDGWADH